MTTAEVLDCLPAETQVVCIKEHRGGVVEVRTADPVDVVSEDPEYEYGPLVLTPAE